MFLGRDMGHQRDYSEEVAEIVDEEVRILIETAHDEAWEILDENRDVLDDLVARAAREGDARQGGDRADLRAAREAPARSVWLSSAGAPGVRPPAGRDRQGARAARPATARPNGSQRARPTAQRPGRRATPRRARRRDTDAAPSPGLGRTAPWSTASPARGRVRARTTPSAPRRPSASSSLAIGEDPERDGLLETPARVARMYAEVFAGLRQRARGRPHHDLRARSRRDGARARHRGVQPAASTTWCRSSARPTSATSRAPTAASPGCPSSPGWSTSSPSGRRCRSG